MTPKELDELNSAIGIISDRNLKDKHNIPYIYTVVVDSVESDGKVKVQFPQDVGSGKKYMTFRNVSGYTPVHGQGAYVLTTGSDNITGGFVIAIQGQPSAFIDKIAEQIVALQNSITQLNDNYTTLNDNYTILNNNYTTLEERVNALEGN
jgi:hypothetical protein